MTVAANHLRTRLSEQGHPNLKVEWTEPHRDDVKAAVRSAVRRVLRRRNVRAEDFDKFLTFIMAQAEALYADYPLAA